MDKRLVSLIGKIYDSALNPNIWETVCLEASEYLKGTSGVMVMHDHMDPAATIAVHTLMPEDIHQHYLEHYYLEKDIWYQLLSNKVAQNSVVIGSQLISERELRKTDMFNEILEPSDGGRLLGHFTANNQAESAAFTISRPMSAPEFDYEDKKIMALLGEHIQRAYLMHRHNYQLSQTNKTMLEALNGINQAIIALDEKGKIIFVNKRAERILDSNDGIRYLNKKLVINDYDQQKKFNIHLQNAIATSNKQGIGAGGAIQVERRSGKAAYQLTVTPISVLIDDNSSNTSALAFIYDPAYENELPLNFLCDLYHLSKAEAKLVQLLFLGLTPKQISENNHVKISTVRTQLHNIFAKTSTTSQVELIKLVTLGAASLIVK